MPLRVCLWFLLLTPTLPADAPERVEFFEKKIRPVLVEHCYQCHSPEAQKNKKLRGGLLLDTRAGLLKGGDTGPALVPGEPDRSLLIKAVGYKDDVLRMPPRSKLPDAVIADLTAWVQMGVPMPASGAAAVSGAFDLEARKKHWSWQPLRPGPVSAVKDRAWPRSSLDAYILAALEAKGLTPAPEADRRTLLRRLSYDLTGLPPTPAEVRAFEGDTAPDAYEKVVDRLLASPHYGERWARHWLDLVRYADTLGHEFDYDLPQAYEYRDYVVRTLNADVPYDQFVLEHLAGDLLERPRRHPKEGFNESVIGTGFFFLGEAKHSPVDVRQDGAERVDNQIDVFSKAFLGLTVACARCHDHKFDAISTRDYYALAGYLRSSRFQRADVNPPGPTREAVSAARRLKRQADALAIKVTAELLDRSLARLADELPAVRAGKGLPHEKLAAWRRYLSRVDRRDTNHFLHRWLAMTEAGELSPEAFRRRLAELDRDYRNKTRTDGYHSLGNFDRGIPHNWFPSGQVADAMAATSVAELQLDAAGPPVARLRGAGQARSDLAGPRAHGVLRSPTFRIENKY